MTAFGSTSDRHALVLDDFVEPALLVGVFERVAEPGAAARPHPDPTPTDGLPRPASKAWIRSGCRIGHHQSLFQRHHLVLPLAGNRAIKYTNDYVGVPRRRVIRSSRPGLRHEAARPPQRSHRPRNRHRCVAREAAEAEADRGVRQLVGQPERRAIRRTARPPPRYRPNRSRSRCVGQASISSGAVRPGKRQVQVAGQPMLGIAVEPQAGGLRRVKFARKPVAQPAQSLGLPAHLGGGDRRGAAQADAERRRQGAGTHAALLATAIEQRHQPHPRPAPEVQGTDALSAHRSCGRRSTSGRSSSPRHRAGFFRRPGPRRCGTARRATGTARRSRRAAGSRRSRCAPPGPTPAVCAR